MASSRVKKLGGIYNEKDFKKVVRQLNGRGVLVVAIINSTCPHCDKLNHFIQSLKGGLIQKLPQLVLLYGYHNKNLNSPVVPIVDPAKAVKDREKGKTGKAQSRGRPNRQQTRHGGQQRQG